VLRETLSFSFYEHFKFGKTLASNKPNFIFSSYFNKIVLWNFGSICDQNSRRLAKKIRLKAQIFAPSINPFFVNKNKNHVYNNCSICYRANHMRDCFNQYGRWFAKGVMYNLKICDLHQWLLISLLISKIIVI